MISCELEKLETSPEISTMGSTVRQRVGRSITRLPDGTLSKMEEDAALVMDSAAPGKSFPDKRVNWLPDGTRREIEEGALLLDDTEEIPLLDQVEWEEIKLKKQDIPWPDQQLMCQSMLMRYQDICIKVAYIMMLVVLVIIYVKFAY